MFRKLNKPQLTKIKQQNFIDIRDFDSRLCIGYTVLLKQKNLPVLDITGFFFRMSTQVKAGFLFPLSTHAEKETCYIQYGKILLFQ